MGLYDQFKKAFQDIVAPEIHALRGEIMRIDGRLAALDSKIDGVDARLGSKIDAVDGRLGFKIDGAEGRLDGKIGALDAKIDAVDAKLGSLRTEMGSLKNELVSEIRRVDVRIDGIDRELKTTIDVRERLAALEARQRA